MPRVQFDLPEQFVFSTPVQIYLSHVNQAGHADNAQLITLLSEARARFFKSLDCTEFDVGDQSSIVVGDLLIQYKAEGFHGDVLNIELRPQDFNKYGFDLAFRMSQSVSGQEVARGKCGIVFINIDSKRPTLRPPTIMGKLLAQAPWLQAELS